MPAPEYAELPGSRTYRQPYTLAHAKARFYMLAAKPAVVQKAVDEWLNVPVNDIFDYVALPWVALCTMPIKQVYSTNPPDREKGYSLENDVAFAVCLAAFRKGVGDVRVIDHFAFTFPFVLVDNPITMTTGREVFGYRKSYGTYEFLPNTQMPIAASTPVMTEYKPTAEQCLREVVRIGGLIDELELVPGHSLEADIDHMLASDLEEEQSFLGRLEEKLLGEGTKWLLRHNVDARDLFRALIRELMKFRQLNVAFLLQLRDITDPDTAAYQALLESPMRIDKIGIPLPIRRADITLSDYHSYPIVSNLGIICDSNYVVKPKLAFTVSMTFQLMNGRVIAEAGKPLYL